MDSKGQSASAAVIDMGSIDEMEIDSSFGTGLNDKKSSDSQPDNTANADYMSSVRGNVANYVWKEGKEKAEAAFKSYANVDLLRPYFDVEPHQVLHRLCVSFVPYRQANDAMKVPSEFYGPTMLCFTLVAVLLLQMKVSNHSVQEGTLMGSALITVFGYWLGASGLLWLVAYVCNTHLRPTQITSLIGYALSSHVLVILVNTVLHSHNSHVVFYVSWAILGGLTTSKLVTVILARTPGHTERIILASLVVILHMMFLVYLHFAYHKIVADLAEVLQQGPGHQPLHVKSLGAVTAAHVKLPLTRRLGAPTRSAGLVRQMGH